MFLLSSPEGKRPQSPSAGQERGPWVRFGGSLPLISPPLEAHHPHPPSSATQPEAAHAPGSSTWERFWGAGDAAACPPHPVGPA